MAQDGGVGILVDLAAPHELARLRTLMHTLGIDRFDNQIDCQGIIPHLKCAIIPDHNKWSAWMGPPISKSMESARHTRDANRPGSLKRGGNRKFLRLARKPGRNY